ncbi:MAG: preprotein translocase subunit SecG [Comamonadaceae bacterium]|nr:MAG: preprotein translocase subunit SecG [Comamonadaceae bacterium]
MFSLLSIVMVIQVVSALAIIVLVLLQQGKGADMGSSFGTGSAGSLFGASGAANFLSRMTKWAAVVFFVATGALAWIGHKGPGSVPADSGLMQNYTPQNRSVPSAPGAAPQSGSSVPGAAVPAANGSVPAAGSPAAGSPAAPQSSVPSTPAVPAPAAPANTSSAPAPATGEPAKQ